MGERILDRLERRDVLVLDGGTGSELHRRGVDLVRARAEPPEEAWVFDAWSATANLDAPEVVTQVHADYLRVGADVLLSNTFWSVPSRLERIGAADEWERYLDAGMDAAIQAKEAAHGPAYVAGAFAPPWLHGWSADDRSTPGSAGSDTEVMGKEAAVKEFRAVGERLAGRGADMVLFENVASVADAVSGMEALEDLEVPVFLGLGLVDADGGMLLGGSIADLERPLADSRVDGVLLMCTELDYVAPALRILRNSYGGYVGAYPNNGYQSADPVDLFAHPHQPSEFARAVDEWLEIGAQLVGGCCGTAPEHIRAIRGAVDARSERVSAVGS
jgi:S-methylmethionine-dependent homocysteine/selenocysteine methylase